MVACHSQKSFPYRNFEMRRLSGVEIAPIGEGDCHVKLWYWEEASFRCVWSAWLTVIFLLTALQRGDDPLSGRRRWLNTESQIAQVETPVVTIQQVMLERNDGFKDLSSNIAGVIRYSREPLLWHVKSHTSGDHGLPCYRSFSIMQASYSDSVRSNSFHADIVRASRCPRLNVGLLQKFESS